MKRGEVEKRNVTSLFKFLWDDPTTTKKRIVMFWYVRTYWGIVGLRPPLIIYQI